MPECHATEYAIEYAIDQVLLDATRSIRDELLPMARALKPKKVLKTLAKSLQISTDELAQTLIELPSLVSDARIDELIACAAKGAEPDDEPEDGVAAGMMPKVPRASRALPRMPGSWRWMLGILSMLGMLGQWRSCSASTWRFA